MATIRTDNVERLNGKNFNTWRMDITGILEAADLSEIVDGTEVRPTEEAPLKAWKKKDAKARSVITPSVTAEQKSHLFSCTTAKEMIDRLTRVHSDAGTLNRHDNLSR